MYNKDNIPIKFYKTFKEVKIKSTFLHFINFINIFINKYFNYVSNVDMYIFGIQFLQNAV